MPGVSPVSRVKPMSLGGCAHTQPVFWLMKPDCVSETRQRGFLVPAFVAAGDNDLILPKTLIGPFPSREVGRGPKGSKRQRRHITFIFKLGRHR